MRLFELIINDEEIDEVFATSLVFNPAIEALGTYFNKDEVHFAEMKEEGLFMAPILIPNKKILRVDGNGVPYEVFFTPETVKKLAQKYLEKKYTDSIYELNKDCFLLDSFEHDSTVLNNNNKSIYQSLQTLKSYNI